MEKREDLLGAIKRNILYAIGAIIGVFGFRRYMDESPETACALFIVLCIFLGETLTMRWLIHKQVSGVGSPLWRLLAIITPITGVALLAMVVLAFV